VFIEIANLKPEPLHIKHVFQIGEIQFDHEDASLNEAVTADFIVTHKDRDLKVGGRVKTGIRFKCSRCIKEFQRPFSVDFDLIYLPQPKWSSKEAEIELSYEDMEVAYYDGINFDVDLMVLEQIELAMPMKFICQENCRGLCYKCGADLNDGSCLCNKEEMDSRLSVLLEFSRKTIK